MTVDEHGCLHELTTPVIARLIGGQPRIKAKRRSTPVTSATDLLNVSP